MVTPKVINLSVIKAQIKWLAESEPTSDWLSVAAGTVRLCFHFVPGSAATLTLFTCLII